MTTRTPAAGGAKDATVHAPADQVTGQAPGQVQEVPSR
jgi:hypothetical protein